MSLLFPKQIDFYSLPVYDDNQSAFDAGLRRGDLFRTSDGTLKMIDTITNLTCNFSSRYSYLGRGF